MKTSAQKLESSITRWSQFSPRAVATEVSAVHCENVLKDAQKDILTLARILADIAYPRAGEMKTLQDYANEIQQIITHEEAVNVL